MNLPALEELLAYKHSHVLRLYEQNYPHNKLPAELAFQEVLKYLWLTQKHLLDLEKNPDRDDLPHECTMLRSMQEIDQMWHEFILFTKDYTSFCLQYFGEYLHHAPNIFESEPLPREEAIAQCEKILPYVYDNLGEETVRVWYAEYLS